MLINVIIKHLLPTAPALSLSTSLAPSSGPPGPHHREGEGGEQEREGGRDRRSQREGLESGEQQIRRGHHHTAGFFYTSERLFFCVVAGQRVKLCDPRTKETRRKEQSDAGKELEGIPARVPPNPL